MFNWNVWRKVVFKCQTKAQRSSKVPGFEEEQVSPDGGRRVKHQIAAALLILRVVRVWILCWILWLWLWRWCGLWSRCGLLRTAAWKIWKITSDASEFLAYKSSLKSKYPLWYNLLLSNAKFCFFLSRFLNQQYTEWHVFAYRKGLGHLACHHPVAGTHSCWHIGTMGTWVLFCPWSDPGPERDRTHGLPPAANSHLQATISHFRRSPM